MSKIASEQIAPFCKEPGGSADSGTGSIRYMAGTREIRINRAVHRLGNQFTVIGPPQRSFVPSVGHEPHLDQHAGDIRGLQHHESGVTIRVPTAAISVTLSRTVAVAATRTPPNRMAADRYTA